MSRSHRVWFSYVVSVLGLFTACVRYAPRPIDPPVLEQAYRARTLSDPGLEEYFRANARTLPTTWPPPMLDLDALTLMALYFSPDLDQARALVAETEAAIVTAGARPNPSVSGGAGYTDAEQSPYALNLGLSIPFETAGKRKYRVRQARQLSEAARFALAETAWRVRSRLRALLADDQISTLEMEQRVLETQIREEVVGIYEKRLEAGEASRPEVSLLRAELARLQVEIEQIRGRIDGAHAAIAGATGLPEAALAGRQLAWENIDTLPTEEALNLAAVQRAGLLNRLDVQRLVSEYAAAETGLQLQVARQYPDMTLGPAYSFGEGANSYTIGPALVLPLFDRNKGPIAEAEARRTAAGARLLSAQAAAIDAIAAALNGYRSALRELERIDEAVEVIRGRQQSTERRLDAGDADRLELANVRLEAAVEARLRLAALRRAQTALGALEDAVQRPLTGGAPMPSVPVTSPRDR